MIALVVAGIVCEQLFGWRRWDRPAFFGASAVVVGLVGIWAVGALPGVIVPASNDPAMSLTASTAAAPQNSLVAMAVVAAIGIPLGGCLPLRRLPHVPGAGDAESDEGYE